MDRILRFFSVPVLLRTLFSPWKRMSISSKSAGISLQKSLDDMTFNLTSRIVGFLVRFWLIVASAVVFFFAGLFGAIGFLVWLLLPPLSIGMKNKYDKQPRVVAQKLVYDILASPNPIRTLFSNEAGKYALSHVGLDIDTMIRESVSSVGLDPEYQYNGYAEVISHVIDSGVWPPDFWKNAEVLSDDLVLAAAIWDGRREIETGLQEDSTNNNVKGVGVQLLFGYTPTLERVGTEMRLLERKHKVLRGREDILKRIERIFDSNRSVLLVGQPGVGKKSILMEMADRLDDDYKRLIDVSIVQLTEGMKDQNERKVAIQSVFKEAASAGNVYLVIKDLPRLTNSQIEGLDFTDVFEDQLDNKKLKLIALTTPDEYEKYISRNFRLMKHFEKVEVTPLDRETATQVLIDRAADLESRSGITITIPILRKMVRTADRYFSETPFPKKALELLEGVITYVQYQNKSAIEPDDIAAVVSERTGIPTSTLTHSDKKKLSNIEDLMKQQLVGQETALQLIAQSLRSRAMGVADNERPVGTFLFLGPTGVGKTETAKVLSRIYYGHSDIIRFDMAEFIGMEGMTKMIGSMQMNQPGMLTTKLRNNPAGMLLLDELEKASDEVYNVLLTLFDEGYIMDAFGRKVDARNNFVIATSNAGSDLIRQLVERGLTGEDLQRNVVEHVLNERLFSPEFINRFDGVVVYEPLSHQDLTQIAQLQLNRLKNRMSEKNIQLHMDDALFQKVAQDGFDPAFGARPMRRVVDLHIGDLISKALLSEQINPGDKVRIIPGLNKNQYHWEKF